MQFGTDAVHTSSLFHSMHPQSTFVCFCDPPCVNRPDKTTLTRTETSKQNHI